MRLPKTIRTFVSALMIFGYAAAGLSGSPHAKRAKRADAAKDNASRNAGATVNSPATDARRAQLANVKTWGYQLRQIVPAEIAASPYDLMVIDYSNDRRFFMEWPLPASDVAVMRKRPDGGRRIMLSYMSVGEAEDYRNYWQWEWLEEKANRPSWLGDENPQWEGNYPVKFWDPGWQAMMFGGPEKYLDSIIRAGFDGVYLDRVDVFAEWAGKYPKAEAEMVKFIERLTAYARRLNPDFLIVIQNGEELVRFPAVRNIIDGVAKESAFYGQEGGPEKRNGDADIAGTLAHLRTARKAGNLVLLVEYANTADAISDIRTLAGAEGFPLLITRRDLGDAGEPQKPPGSATSPRGNN
jgi:cysteinyl-tRNA synthetase, unknown class